MDFDQEHRELDKKIMGCTKCKPFLTKYNYCKDCVEAVVNFMNSYGAGTLCQDGKVECLEREIAHLKRANLGLKDSLEQKNRRVEELHLEVMKLGEDKA